MNIYIMNMYVNIVEKHLGGIEIIYDGKHTRKHDDIIGWKFCPYCGEPLWGEEPWLE